MKTKKENRATGTIIEHKFKVDPKFRDPLLSENIFEEMEVEENKYYYQIHLGVPQNMEEI